MCLGNAVASVHNPGYLLQEEESRLGFSLKEES